ncbi:hypothetical protein RSAG8_08093, partial [Rhizoctonia solani AG-8 WAC10335]
MWLWHATQGQPDLPCTTIMFLIDQICSPPELPPYLKNVHDLKSTRGIPEDEEMIGIHAVIRMAQKVVDVPGVGNSALLYQLTWTPIPRSNGYLDVVFPENIIYTPPNLPTHISVRL